MKKMIYIQPVVGQVEVRCSILMGSGDTTPKQVAFSKNTTTKLCNQYL